MTIGEGLKKALYITVGAIAIGVESLADAADSLAEKGSLAVEKGKEMYKEARDKRRFRDEDEPAVVIEEDDGGNAPVPNA